MIVSILFSPFCYGHPSVCFVLVSFFVLAIIILAVAATPAPGISSSDEFKIAYLSFPKYCVSEKKFSILLHFVQSHHYHS